MADDTNNRPSSLPADLESVASEIYNLLGRTFPICSASDEFYYFPQVIPSETQWSKWDDFSPETVDRIIGQLSSREENLKLLAGRLTDLGSLIDISVLRTMCSTLRGQLSEVGFHRTQPTFHLTVANIGLAEALASSNSGAWDIRAKGLPGFLDRAGQTLDRVPDLFRDLGLSMARRSRDWLKSLRKIKPDIGPVLKAFDQFESRLKRMTTSGEAIVPGQQADLIVRNHIGCQMSLDECLREIDLEIEEMEESLHKEAAKLTPGLSWREAARQIPRRTPPAGGIIDFFRNEIEKMKTHCSRQGLIPPGGNDNRLLEIAFVPPHLAPVRIADAYAARPGYPPAGGTFFILQRRSTGKKKQSLSLEYRATAAHETFPGHHLLDVHRWGQPRAVRRPLEFPLFYEGWACFAEELLSQTGYFSDPWDKLILARRRFKRAVRGKIDLRFISGRIDLEEAVLQMADQGFSSGWARSAVPNYALRPGYQVCYTIGLRRLLELQRRYGGQDPAGFAREILTQAEIGFENLEKVLENRSKGVNN